MPAGVGSVDHLVESGVARRVVAIQDIFGAAAGEIADADHAVGGGGSADIVPAGVGAIDDLIDPGVAGGIVAIEHIIGATAGENRLFRPRCRPSKTRRYHAS